MQRTLWILAGALSLGLAACGDNDLERSVVGATIGGVGAAATHNSMAAGVVAGAAAGALCDDVGLCKR